jgi:hypothetical protein
MVNTVESEIEDAKQKLNLPVAQFARLSEDEADRITQLAESRFVGNTGLSWWWENFQQPYLKVLFPKQNGSEYLSRIVPDSDEMLWFIVGVAESEAISVYEGRIAELQSLIGECPFFEYYIVPKDFRWLLCENHHNYIFAVGREVEHRLLLIENPDQ